MFRRPTFTNNELNLPYLCFDCVDEAVKRDPCFASNVKKIVILGGAFFTAGNVNPAAEANVKYFSHELCN